MTLTVRRALASDGPCVARAVDDLLLELFEQAPRGVRLGETASAMLADPSTFVAFIAEDEGQAVGVLTLGVCRSLYAGGAYGQIAELQVNPAWRSGGVGAALLDAAVAYGRELDWPMLEVNTPPAETWSRTLAFYRSHGFQDNGPFLSLQL